MTWIIFGMVIIALNYVILIRAIKEQYFGYTMIIISVASAGILIGLGSKEISIFKHIEEKQVVERIYDASTGKLHYFIKDDVVGFTEDLEPIFKEE